MDFKAAVVDGSGRKDEYETRKYHDNFVTSIPEMPVTVQRRPFKQPDVDVRLHHAGKMSIQQSQLIALFNQFILTKGTARANLASTEVRPEGTTEGDWARKHQKQTVCSLT